MLITKEQIIHACNLTDKEVMAAMLAGGYTEEYRNVKFLGVNAHGQFVYQMDYDNFDSGEVDQGKVYLAFMRGALHEGWYLVGDY
jgi:hypothetical protein